MVQVLKSRYKIWWSIFWRGKWRRGLLILWLVLGAYDLLSSQFLSNKLPPVRDFLPEWQWQYWVIVALALVLIIFLEGIYEKEKESAKGNWILDHKLRTGKYPLVPEFLIRIVDPNTYKKGDPITKNIKVIPMGAQFLNGLSPTDKEKFKQLVEFTGRDWADYEWQMKQMLPTSQPNPNIRWL
jgi:hypothetical protein